MVVEEFFIVRGLMLVALLGISCSGYGMEMQEVREDIETPLSNNQSSRRERQQPTAFEYSRATPWVTSMSHARNSSTRPGGSRSAMKKSDSAPEIHASTNHLLQLYAASLSDAETQKNTIEVLKGVLAVITTNQGIVHDQTSSGIAQTNVQVGQEGWKTRLWGLVGAAVTSLIAIIPQFIGYYGTGVDCNGHAHNSTMSS